MLMLVFDNNKEVIRSACGEVYKNVFVAVRPHADRQISP